MIKQPRGQSEAGLGLRIGSLFSGIGGLELGLERAGLGRVIWQCEIEPFARQVLAKHWPDASRFDDVTMMGLDGEIPPVDVVCGGFPCQDLSVAGRGEGLHGAKSGLFFELMRVVRLVRPRIVVLENVPALATRGLGEVLGELAQAGFDAEWATVSAGSLGAAHRRERIFIVAYANGLRELQPQGGEQEQRRRAGDGDQPNNLSHAHSAELREQSGRGSEARGEEADLFGGDGADGRLVGCLTGPGVFGELLRDQRRHTAPGGVFDAQPVVGGGPHGVSSGVDGVRRGWERGLCRAIPKVKGQGVRSVQAERRARLKALGNAVVPQVAEFIGRRIVDALSQDGGE